MLDPQDASMDILKLNLYGGAEMKVSRSYDLDMFIQGQIVDRVTEYSDEC